MPREVPVVYIKEGDKVVAKEALLVERKCWWCLNPFMYEVRKPSWFGGEVVWYECCSCGARVDQYEKVFRSGDGERKSV